MASAGVRATVQVESGEARRSSRKSFIIHEADLDPHGASRDHGVVKTIRQTHAVAPERTFQAALETTAYLRSKTVGLHHAFSSP